MKISASSAACDDAQHSARRKKGVEYPVLYLPCPIPDCGKIFNRSCDLSKHEKTHTRPYKCMEPGCKFNKIGLPTEQELDRHHIDKHGPFYSCEYCEFKTRRNSNRYQHMEKKHGWAYVRLKGRDKAASLTAGPSPKTPAHTYPSSEPSPVSQSMT